MRKGKEKKGIREWRFLFFSFPFFWGVGGGGGRLPHRVLDPFQPALWWREILLCCSPSVLGKFLILKVMPPDASPAQPHSKFKPFLPSHPRNQLGVYIPQPPPHANSLWRVYVLPHPGRQLSPLSPYPLLPRPNCPSSLTNLSALKQPCLLHFFPTFLSTSLHAMFDIL